MLAWAPTHDEHELRGIVARLGKLPSLSPQAQYRLMKEQVRQQSSRKTHATRRTNPRQGTNRPIRPKEEPLRCAAAGIGDLALVNWGLDILFWIGLIIVIESVVRSRRNKQPSFRAGARIGRPGSAPARDKRVTPAEDQSCSRFSRRALKITDTELKLMAAAAMIGLSNIPNHGYNTPAAIGTPIEL